MNLNLQEQKLFEPRIRFLIYLFFAEGTYYKFLKRPFYMKECEKVGVDIGEAICNISSRLYKHSYVDGWLR